MQRSKSIPLRWYLLFIIPLSLLLLAAIIASVIIVLTSRSFIDFCFHSSSPIYLNSSINNNDNNSNKCVEILSTKTLLHISIFSSSNNDYFNEHNKFVSALFFFRNSKKRFFKHQHRLVRLQQLQRLPQVLHHQLVQVVRVQQAVQVRRRDFFLLK